MEYFVGAAITVMAFAVINLVLRKNNNNEDPIRITYSQSHIYELMRPFINMVGPIEDDVKRQSINYLKNIYMRVMIVKDKAYWIKDNIFYVADVVNGEVNKENARAVDTMAMSKVELDEMLFIVEKLREDDNDSRGSGQ